VLRIYQTVSEKLFGKSEWASLRVPGVGKTREQGPLLALCTTENTRSRPALLFTKQFLVLQPQLARVGFAMMEDAARGATMVQTTPAWSRVLERLHGRIALASDVPNRGDDRWLT
jgi:hypothetical protein